MMKGDVLPASPAALPPQRHERTPVLQTHRGCCKEQGSTSDQGSAAHLHPKEGRWAWQRCRVPWLQNKTGCFGERGNLGPTGVWVCSSVLSSPSTFVFFQQGP